jgi:uncharacterized membrane protein YvlD (DUF360 family)
MTSQTMPADYGEAVAWQPDRPKFKLLRLLLSWALTAAALCAAAAILPGVDIAGTGGALAVAAVVAILNAVLPPVLAALRLPFMIALGFVLVLALNAFILKLASDVLDNTFTVDNFGWALLAALIVAAVTSSALLADRGVRPARTCLGSSSSRSTASRFPFSGGPCGTGTHPIWPAGSRKVRTG